MLFIWKKLGQPIHLELPISSHFRKRYSFSKSCLLAFKSNVIQECNLQIARDYFKKKSLNGHIYSYILHMNGGGGGFIEIM